MAKIKFRKKAAPRKPRAAKGFLDTKYSIGEIASKALKTATYVAGLVNVEEKIIDSGAIAIANTQFTTAGTVFYVSGVAQGIDYNQRIGNSVKMQYIDLIMYTLAGTTSACTRVILFRDREQRQAVPAVTDVLETANPYAHYNHNNLERFTILKDEYRSIDAYHPTHPMTFTKTDRTHLRYISTAATIGSADENALFLLVLSDTASGVTSPSAVYNMRIGFVDN